MRCLGDAQRARGIAALAQVDETGIDAFVDGALEVAIGKDEVRRRATKLQRHALYRISAFLEDGSTRASSL